MNLIHAYLLAKDSNDWTELSQLVERGDKDLLRPEYEEVRVLIAKQLRGEIKKTKPKKKPFYILPKSRLSNLFMFLLSGAGYPLKKSSDYENNKICANQLVSSFFNISGTRVVDYWNEKEQEQPDEFTLGMMSLEGVMPYKTTIVQSGQDKWLDKKIIQNSLAELNHNIKNKNESTALKQYDMWVFGRTLWLFNKSSAPNKTNLVDVVNMILAIDEDEFCSLALTAKKDWFDSRYSIVK
jgi:hypothetical protein